MKIRFNLRLCCLFLLFLALSAPYRFYVLNLPTISSFSVVEIGLGLGVVYTFFHITKNGQIFIGPRLLFAVLAVPAIISALSLSWTQEVSFTFNEIIVSTEALVTYLVVINLAFRLNRNQLLKILFIFSLSLLLFSFISYPPFSFVSPQLPGGETNSGTQAYLLSYHARLSHPFIGLSNNYATILAVVFPVTLYIGKYFHSKLWIFMSALLLGAIIGTLSRGVIFALFAAFLSTFSLQMFFRQKIKESVFKHLFFIMIGVSLLAIIIYLMVPKIATHLIDRTNLRGMNVRVFAFKEALQAIFERPFFGYGGGLPFASFSTSSLTSIHNTFLQRFFWYGLPFGLVASLCLISLPMIFKQIQCTDSFQRHVKKGTIVALLCQILLMLGEASWEGSVLRVIIYAFLGLAVALLRARPATEPQKI